MLFAYTAFDESGRLHKGELDAADTKEAERWVLEHHFGFVQVKSKRVGKPSWLAALTSPVGGTAVPPVQASFFCTQVAAMLRVGVPISQALAMQADTVRHKALRGIAKALADRVSQGNRVSDALSVYPRVFSPIVVRVLQGAEQVGHLEAGFQDAGEHIMAGHLITKKITGAMYYPGFAIVMLLGAGYFMVYDVFPKLVGMYAAFDVKLPGITVAMMNFTHFALQNGPHFLEVLVALVLSILAVLRTDKGKLIRDRLFLKLPVMGQVIRLGAVTRFLRTLRSALASALPLEEAVDLSAAASGNGLFRQEIGFAKPQIVSGQGISGPLKETNLFPPLITQGIEIAEETGTLDDALRGLVEYYENELNTKVAGIAEALNPILTVIAAIGVGFLMAATLLPMYYIMGHVKVQ